ARGRRRGGVGHRRDGTGAGEDRERPEAGVACGDAAGERARDLLTRGGEGPARARGTHEGELGGQRVGDRGGGRGGEGPEVAHHEGVVAVQADGEGGGVALVEREVGHAADGGRIQVAVVGRVDVKGGARRGRVGDGGERRGRHRRGEREQAGVAGGEAAGERGGDDLARVGEGPAGARGAHEREPGGQRVGDRGRAHGRGGAGVAHHQCVGAVLRHDEGGGVALVEAEVRRPGDGGGIQVAVVGRVGVAGAGPGGGVGGDRIVGGGGGRRVGDRRERRGCHRRGEREQGGIAGGEARGERGGDDRARGGEGPAGARRTYEREAGRQRVAHGGGARGRGSAEVAHHQRVGSVLTDGEGGGVALVQGQIGRADERRVGGAVAGGVQGARGRDRGGVDGRR